jgi:hypothetical protein
MTDAYEREAMPGVGEVLFRHKVTSPRWLVGLSTFLPSTILGVGGIVTALTVSPLAGLGMIAGSVAVGVLMSFLMVTFATARVAVSEGELHVQIGMAGPKIPIAEIASVRVAPSGRNKLGMGASIDFQGNRYIRMWGDNQKAVHVELTSGKKLVMTTKEPEAMAAALQEAIRRRDAHRPKVRIAEAEAEHAEAEAALEAEAKARATERTS